MNDLMIKGILYKISKHMIRLGYLDSRYKHYCLFNKRSRLALHDINKNKWRYSDVGNIWGYCNSNNFYKSLYV
jgi:hypothetical protein